MNSANASGWESGITKRVTQIVQKYLRNIPNLWQYFPNLFFFSYFKGLSTQLRLKEVYNGKTLYSLDHCAFV